jgi:hypothetical protein
MTTAAAMKMSTWPRYISSATAPVSRSGNAHRPTSQMYVAAIAAVQSAANHGHGRAVSGERSCANTGA